MLKKNNLLEIIILIVFLLFFYLDWIFKFCNYNIKLDFDFQNFFVWIYSAQKGLFPYKDIFYYYGLLNYFKNNYFLIRLLDFSIITALFTGSFIFFRSLFNKISSYILFIIFFIVVNKYVGVDYFNRYGIGTIGSLILGYTLYKNKIFQKKTSFVIGFGTSIIFSLVNDQGIYLLFSYLLFSFINILENKKNLKLFIEGLLSYILGLLVGVIPLIIFLILKKCLNYFIIDMFHLVDISTFAKVPVLNELFIKENYVTFIILLISIVSYLSKFIFHKSQITKLYSYFQLSLIINLLLLEQKNIVRPLGVLVIYITFMLAAILLHEVNNRLFKENFTKMFSTLFIFMFSVFIIIILNLNVDIYTYFQKLEENANETSNILFNINNSLAKNQCSDQVERLSTTSKIQPYLKIKKFIKQEKNSNSKVFSFPGDPIFYPLFDQKPPPFLNLYDSSSLYAQNRNINYLKMEEIDFIIFNTDIKKIEDNVPDVLRGNTILKYIINNYYPYKEIDNFLILKKNTIAGKDFFKSSLINDNDKISNYFFEIDLNSIPVEEAHYKLSLIKDISKEIYKTSNINDFNNFLNKNNLKTRNIVLLIKQKSNIPDRQYIVLKSKDGFETNVYMQKCNNICLINLSNLPIFFKERTLSELSTAMDLSSLVILKVSPNDILW